MPRTERPQADPEIVFTVLRVLLSGWSVWGAASAMQLSDLLRAGRGSREGLLRALVCLRAQGLISIDRKRGVVSLTGRALNELVAGGSL